MRTPDQLQPEIPHFELLADVVDQCLDFTLNLSQSGHPGGSRSKVHALLTLLLSGAMRWDVSQPVKRFGDRFVLVAGHTNPVVYAALAVFNEALAERRRRSGDERFGSPLGPDFTLTAEDLLTLRQHGGLPGHAEMEGKTLFFKCNTGPSGHGAPMAAGQALALRHAGASDVRVFALEGEGGHTAGAWHETKNSAWGLGLGNLVTLLDWNDCGIDDHRISSVVHGGPQQWFESHGWRVAGTEQGSDFASLFEAFHSVLASREQSVPACVWFKTRKGRGYGKYDNKSHGAPHKYHDDGFWAARDDFCQRRGVEFVGRGEQAPGSREQRVEQTRENLSKALDVLRQDEGTLNWLTDRLTELGESVPASLPSFRWDLSKDPLDDPALTDPASLPDELFLAPGTQAANRAGFANFGAYANALGKSRYGRPLFLVCAADLADSTNISGFGKDWQGSEGYGWYEREQHPDGVILPQEITEFTNAGIICGAASVNFSERPFEGWRGYMTSCSTYASFSYLKYGPMRLFSQMCQDSQAGLGRVIWVAGHSGPETAEDSRTHFGIFAPGITSMFPRDQVVNLHPWEANEVPVVLSAALGSGIPIIVLHLTRPPITLPDRQALGMDSHMDAARGAYVIRPFDEQRPKDGVVIVRGTSTTASMMELLPWLASGEGPNVKLVAAISHALFRRQPSSWQQRVLPAHEWAQSMVATNTARRLMGNWIPHAVAEDYVLSPDWDDRWRTGGSLSQITAEAHLDPESLKQGIQRFVDDRAERQRRMTELLGQAEGLSCPAELPG
ncbi:MAG: transketolase [Planctomycetota bacterium]|nr:MAG: transketolase [Planctomycetota bacterium]